MNSLKSILNQMKNDRHSADISSPLNVHTMLNDSTFPLFLDGGTGSVLQAKGLKPGELPEKWNLTHKDDIIQLHYDYFRAGSNIINTNTFGAFSFKFPNEELEKIIHSACENANEARKRFLASCENCGRNSSGGHENGERNSSGGHGDDGEVHCEKNTFVLFDIGPTGKLLKPMGDLDFEDAVDIYKTTFRLALKENVDGIFIETMSDSYETKAAVLAAKEVREELNSDAVIFASNAYDKSGRLLTGATPEAMVCLLEGLGVDALGLNCSLGPDDMKETVRHLLKVSSTPIIVKPNAGLPHDENGKAVFDVNADDFACSMAEIFKMGATILGGCCGTTAEYIGRMLNEIASVARKGEFLAMTGERTDNEIASVARRDAELAMTGSTTTISSYTHAVQIGDGALPVLIGERINPTGKKRFKEALRVGDISYIVKQGLEQEVAGADVLDVNVGLPEIDEREMMVRVVGELQSVTDLPLQIDTSSPLVMEAALRRYNGKALINSVNGKREVMDAIFPLVKKYGGVVVALTLDENGIPETAEGRIAIAKKIYDVAESYGIAKNDIVIDALTMAVSSDTNVASATLETVKAIHAMGGKTILGVSNISFGLPSRETVSSAFFTMAMANGLDAAIMNPLSLEMMKAYKCFCLLSGKDKNCAEYIEFAQKIDCFDCSQVGKTRNDGVSGGRMANEIASSATQVGKTRNDDEKLENAVIHGLKDDAATETKKMLDSGMEAIEIIDGHLIKALDFVGKRFEAKTMYLPQLLMAADAASASFSVIKTHLEATGKKGKSKGSVILATVKGDIHDIGKNIVRVLLENYDFTVIDLGKDVPPEKIVETCVKNKIQLVGLSALMTTTVPMMKETIELLKKASPTTKVCVGGAVLTQEYADSIGADFYAKDAMTTVEFAKRVFG